jgi:3-dehydroquinate dehydratase-2
MEESPTMQSDQTKPVLFLNGPNLNLLGIREPDKYGTTTLAEVEEMVSKEAALHGLSVRFAQSNHEGELIEAIHAARTECSAIVFNPAGYGHTSVVLRDALLAVRMYTVEVHVTSLYRRERWRRELACTAEVSDVVIQGAGVHGYVLAAAHVAHWLAHPLP